jgi:hypothetical protein
MPSTKPTDPAFPVYEGTAIDAQYYAKSQGGLTKFELASIEAMTGICANPNMNGASPATIAKRAVNCAKALLAALAKEQV